MAEWLLNSAVIAAGGYGEYRYSPMTSLELVYFLGGRPIVTDADQPGVISRIGYLETANLIRRWAGRTVPISRETSCLAVGDRAAVVRLRYRVRPTSKGEPVAATDDDWELGLLERLS